MPHKNSYITVTDQFCGAGGSSQGARRYSNKIGGGIEVKIALNHWKLAIETHNTNFPETIHDCTDISACDPRRYPSTDILITSPECTTHSPAGGNNHKQLKKQMDLFHKQVIDPATERSRATMWDVCRFAEYHKYNIIIVENVVEAKTKWVLFDDWLRAMHTLGYDHKCVYLNSMHCHPTPQSRDRMYVVFWKKNNKAPQLDYTPAAFCHHCEKAVHALQAWKKKTQFGKYRQQYVYCCPTCTATVEPYYYAAFNCIDWSDMGKRIGDRTKPLSENTMNRIHHGLRKYGKSPLVIHTQYGKEGRNLYRSVNQACFAQTTNASQALINHPFIVNTLNGENDQTRVKSTLDRNFTQTTYTGQLLINPFIISTEHSYALKQCRHIKESLQTQATRQTMAMVNMPWIIEMNRTGECKPASESTSAITAGGINHAFMMMPFITQNKGQSKSRKITDATFGQTCKESVGLVTNEAWNSFISYNYNGNQTSHITEATDGINCKERLSIINYKEPQIEECYYRMLKSREIKLAMAFDNDYIVLGSSKDQVKQLGNAVTPPAMEWLIQQCVESLS